jgi:adenine/guanine phosphoribosyltransferase-like PRPP-binding protein
MASGHLENAIGPSVTLRTIRKIVRQVMESGIEFDTIACTGISGISLGPVVAALLKKNVAIIRKVNEECHSIYIVEFAMHEHFPYAEPKRFVFLDDLIDSGSTFSYVDLSMFNKYPGCACVGGFLYNNTRTTYHNNLPMIGCHP